MKIIQLKSTNIKKLKAVLINANGESVIIGGKNGAGKSSVLDSITVALAGKSAIPQRPIRDGEEHAEVEIDLGELTVTRTFNRSGTTSLVVKSKEGAKYPSPQGILDKLCGELTFDPLEFTRLDPKKQVETLRKLVGLDFTELDGKRTALYSNRTEIGRQADAAKSRFQGALHFPDAPAEELNSEEIGKKLKAASDTNMKNAAVRAELASQKQHLSRTVDQIIDLKDELETLKKRIADLEKVEEAVKADITVRTKAVDALVDVSVQQFTEETQKIGETNRQVRANQERVKLQNEHSELDSKYNAMTAQIEKIDKEKSDLLAKAKFPLPGLSFTEDGIVYNKVPLSQASGAELLRISTAIGIALNPKLRVMLVRDGSLLDPDSLKLLIDLASDNDAQVWVEHCYAGKDASVVIEDGLVKQ